MPRFGTPFVDSRLTTARIAPAPVAASMPLSTITSTQPPCPKYPNDEHPLRR